MTPFSSPCCAQTILPLKTSRVGDVTEKKHVEVEPEKVFFVERAVAATDQGSHDEAVVFGGTPAISRGCQWGIQREVIAPRRRFSTNISGRHSPIMFRQTVDEDGTY